MNPYAKFLGDRNPLEALSDSPARIGALVESWRPDVFARSYAQGKWDARQILIHLAHVEMALGYRARQALTISSYQVTPFDQDAWLAKDPSLDGPSAYRAYRGLRELNLALFRNLSAEDRARTFSHPQYGTQPVTWIIETLAGHDINHLGQLQTIANEPVGAGR